MIAKLAVIGCLFLGAFCGWWFSAAFWIATRPGRATIWSTDRIEILLTAYGCVLLSALCSAGKDGALRRRLVVGVTIGSVLGFFWSPPTTQTFEGRLADLFVDPMTWFTPTSVVVGAFFGGVVELFYPDVWRSVQWIRDRISRARSQDSQE